MNKNPVDLDLYPAYIQQLQTGPLIGRGTFGLVFKGAWEGRPVAIKQIVGENERLSFSQEVAHLSRVNHENIIKCFGYSLQHVLLVVEYAECGSLHQLLHAARNRSVHYNLGHAISWALQCARGVQHLHDMKPKPIVHRDLKPLNLLLVDQCRTIKICDFGTACAVHTNMTVAQGSVAWMAPEVFQGHTYTEKCDIYSWAVTFWQVLSRQLPYFNLDSPAQSTDSPQTQPDSAVASAAGGCGGAASFRIMWAVHSGERPQLLKQCPLVLEQLLENCWSEQPNKRPFVDQVIAQIEQLFWIIQSHSTLPLQLPDDPSTNDGYTSNSTEIRYDVPNQIVTEPPVSCNQREEIDRLRTLPANVPLSDHNQERTDYSPPFLSLSSSSSSSTSKKLLVGDQNRMENFSSKKATRTLVQKFASDWFNTDDRTLIYQPNTSNVFSASSEIRVHPPQDMTTSSKCDLDSKVVSIRRASSTLNDEVDLDEFVHMLNPKALDPQHLFAKRLQMSSQPEVLAPIHVYRHQFHEFISTLSNVLQTRCVDGRVRAALTSARNELQGQLNNLRRILNQREAAEDGWEYVDQ